MPLDMARHAAIPLPVPRSAAAGGVGARPGKSLAPDRSRGQAGGLAAERGRRPVAVELAIGALVRAGGGGLLAESAISRLRSSEARLEAGGKTQARLKGGHSAIGRTWGANGGRKPSPRL